MIGSKSAKSRAATLRRELQELEEEEQSVIAEVDLPPAPATAPAPASAPAPAAAPDPATASDPVSFVAATLQSAVIILLLLVILICFKHELLVEVS